jgi:precorrin-6B methylase 2
MIDLTNTMESSESILRTLYRVTATAIPPGVRNRILCGLLGIGNKLQVRSGVFAGMRYVRESVGGELYPKLLGTYELELASLIKVLNDKRVGRIIDVGAAEGYYAVGLAICNPQATVIAFEATPEGMALIKRMAVENGVAGRVDIRGYCAPEDLGATLGDGADSLVVMDVEGAEDRLIDLQRCPGLARAHLLIELHTLEIEGIAESLTERLRATHRIVDVWARERTLEDAPVKLSRFSRALLGRLYLRAMNERRLERMRWMYCEPNFG